jgi:hypothetical protein
MALRPLALSNEEVFALLKWQERKFNSSTVN